MQPLYDYIPENCQWTIQYLSLVPHALLFVTLIASICPHAYKWHARVSFHSLYGLVLLLIPSLAFAPKVSRPLDHVHYFLARFIGPFQLGYAYYTYKTRFDRYRPEPGYAFAKAVGAGLVFANELFNHYRSTNERGLHLDSALCLYALILVDFTYFLVEAYEFIDQARHATNSDEIDALAGYTKRLVENRSSIRLQYILWADAFILILYAVVSIPSTDYIYKNVIDHSILLDPVHRLITAEFGYLALATAIISLLAAQFTVYHQRTFIEQRILIAILHFAVHCLGSRTVYYFAQFAPHYISLLSSIALYFAYQESTRVGLLPEEKPEHATQITTRIRAKINKLT